MTDEPIVVDGDIRIVPKDNGRGTVYWTIMWGEYLAEPPVYEWDDLLLLAKAICEREGLRVISAEEDETSYRMAISEIRTVLANLPREK